MPGDTSPTATTGATPAAGATPAGAAEAGSTTPTGATPAPGTSPTPPPATGEETLAEAGKAILRQARAEQRAAEERARTAESERDALKAATQTDSEKAIATAVKEAEKATADRFAVLIRRSEVRRALTAAGIVEAELDLASSAAEFAKLKLTDAGDVEGLAEVIATFKQSHASLFARTTQPDFGGGQRGTTPTGEPTMNEILRAAAGRSSD